MKLTFDYKSAQTGTLTLQVLPLYGNGTWKDVSSVPLIFVDYDEPLGADLEAVWKNED